MPQSIYEVGRSDQQQQSKYLPARLLGNSSPQSQRRTSRNTSASGPTVGSLGSSALDYERMTMGQREFPQKRTDEASNRKPLPMTSIYDSQSNFRDIDGQFSDPHKSASSRSLSSHGQEQWPVADQGDLTDKEAQKRAENERTITVYGFSPDKVSMVLSYLDYSGKVEECWSTDELKNGIHVRFDTETSAQRALGKGGVFVDDETMIGVCKYDPSRYQGKRHMGGMIAADIEHSDLIPRSESEKARDEYRVNPKHKVTIGPEVFSRWMDSLFGF
eukprot:CFRG7247T1